MPLKKMQALISEHSFRQIRPQLKDAFSTPALFWTPPVVVLAPADDWAPNVLPHVLRHHLASVDMHLTKGEI